MKKKRDNKRRKIPESLGNRLCGVWPYILMLVFDAAVHGTILFVVYGVTLQNFFRLFFSFIFFIYPLYFVADALWSLRPSVCRILSGETAINRKYYMNTVRKEVFQEELLPVTISVPVYLESNEVIFETLRDSLAAVKRYREFSSAAANVVVSDDGLAPLLGGRCTAEKVKSLLLALKNEDSELTLSEKKAAERILFYRTHNISFVARPADGRKGLFKKASNLNYTLRLGKAMEDGTAPEELAKDKGTFADGYWDGDISNHEVILLLDKDSGVKEGIIEAIAPEFAADEKLAYVQCATSAGNLDENYYTYATGRHINNLFHNIWPCKALQGFFVPLVGHNVFIRRSLLEKSGLWAEDRVSEDYDKALCLYKMGYHGKYAQIRGLEFTEYASRTFTEETGKQRRYAYGMFEMLFDGTVFSSRLRGLRGCDVFYMLLYFCSILNQALLLPTVLLESYFGNIHLLWAGFLCCMLCFIMLPLIRRLVMRRRLPKEHVAGLLHTLVIALSFVGHAFSVLAGACRYLTNKIRENSTPFPSTNVDHLRYRFRDGVKLIVQYIRRNPLFLVIAFLCLDRGIFLVTQKGLEPVTAFTYGYILFCTVLVPVFLTPPLFAGLSRRSVSMEPEVRSMGKNKKKKTMGYMGFSGQRDGNRGLTPFVIEKESVGPAESDIESFLADYQETLLSSLSEDGMPEDLLSEYIFESCLRKDPDSRKELYLLQRKKDGAKALLRITKNYPEEDALEEAKILQRLDHPGVPKVFSSYEKDGKSHLVREYIEGRTLHDIISAKGCLSAEDIFGIAEKLAGILRYLHTQSPPVIHRDIKPQNIIVGRDGSIHLIDFGIAREHKGQRRQDTSVVLTLDYASPEQYGFEQTTPLSDIYSFGVVLLFLATGRTVRSDLEAQIINNRLRELIEQCIAFNPKARIQSAGELLHYLQRNNNHSALKRKRIAIAAAGVTAAALCLCVLSYGAGFAMERQSAKTRGYERGYQAGYTDGYDAAPQFTRNYDNSIVSDGTDFRNMSAAEGAFVAEGEDIIFYIADSGIWSMSASGTNPALLVPDENAVALNFRGGWLYYSSGDTIVQTNIYTSESDILCSGLTGSLYVTEKYFYIQTEDGVSLLDINTGETTSIENLSDCKALHSDGEYLYFISGKDQALYRCGFTGENRTKLLDGPCWSICLFGGEMFCSAEQNGGEVLLRLNAETGETELLLEAQASILHVSEDVICFLDMSDSRIYRCSMDGRIRERISANPAQDYNLAGDWVFYHNQEDGGRLWCVRLDGANDHPSSSGR